jgi:hypothetical protein
MAKKKRNNRKKKRQARVEARKRAMSLAMDSYEVGDDAESLQEKVESKLLDSGEEIGSFWIEILKYIIPIVLKMLVGI